MDPGPNPGCCHLAPKWSVCYRDCVSQEAQYIHSRPFTEQVANSCPWPIVIFKGLWGDNGGYKELGYVSGQQEGCRLL